MTYLRLSAQLVWILHEYRQEVAMQINSLVDLFVSYILTATTEDDHGDTTGVVIDASTCYDPFPSNTNFSMVLT